MINYWLDVIACSLVVLFEVIGSIGLAMLIQLISYQCFGINLYQKLNKSLNKLDKYLTNLFL